MNETDFGKYSGLKFDIVSRALCLALKKHNGQYRLDGETPYVVHPIRVFFILVEKLDVHDEEVLSAALLHDVIEDTKSDFEDILELFPDCPETGKTIADMVAELTDFKALPKELREEDFLHRLSKQSWELKIVKLADCYDNLYDFKGLSPEKRIEVVKKDEKEIPILVKDLPERYDDFVEEVKTVLQKRREEVNGIVPIFAYGSNMSTHQMIERNVNVLQVKIGRVKDHELVFRGKSTRSEYEGGALADIDPKPDEEVWGVLCYTDGRLKDLDRAEGVDLDEAGCKKTPVNVETASGTQDALAYVRKVKDEVGKPHPEYLNRILDGAKEHNLPESYIERIKSLSS